MNTMEREEFYNFLLQNQEKFYRLAYSYVKTPEAALDIVQEATANALANLQKLKEPSYQTTWFYRIIVNTALQYLRKNSKCIYTDTMPETAGEPHSLYTEDKMDLYHAVMSLDFKYRSIILLRYFEDLKLTEVAQILKIPESTVKTRIRTALSSLKKYLEGGNIYGE